MKIGLISDTHSYLDERVFTSFEACDEIWHAGDIGDQTVIERLENFKPFRAVYGNIDDKTIQWKFPEDLRFTCGGVDVFMTHIGGSPPNYNPRVKKLLREAPPALFICGHSHILRIKRDENLKGMLFVNPGAAGNQGFHKIKTLVRFELNVGRIEKMEVIELGKRAGIQDPVK